jgi:hypothetical protein
MTRLAPASTSIGAATDPVKAPDADAWQSCPPTAAPGAAATIAPISVNGGQSATSTEECASAAAKIAFASPSAAVSPFIFQLPTTYLRRVIAHSLVHRSDGFP